VWSPERFRQRYRICKDKDNKRDYCPFFDYFGPCARRFRSNLYMLSALRRLKVAHVSHGSAPSMKMGYLQAKPRRPSRPSGSQAAPLETLNLQGQRQQEGLLPLFLNQSYDITIDRNLLQMNCRAPKVEEVRPIIVLRQDRDHKLCCKRGWCATQGVFRTCPIAV
jgi:hypothetical protein